MVIKISDPVFPRKEYVDLTIAYEDALMLQRIRDSVGKIDAIRILRWYNKNIGIRQAKEFIEDLAL